MNKNTFNEINSFKKNKKKKIKIYQPQKKIKNKK